MPYDKRLFADRLQESRKEKENCRTQTDFAAAFEQYLETTGEKNVKSKLPIIKKWESAASPTIPETRTLFKLCDFLDVDCDYLTGRIDSQTHDLKFISEFTGLPETTISKIQGLSKAETKILSEIIDHPNLKKILQTIVDLSDHDRLNQDLSRYIIDRISQTLDRLGGNTSAPDPVHTVPTSVLEDVLIHAVLAAFENIVRDISDTPIS